MTIDHFPARSRIWFRQLKAIPVAITVLASIGIPVFSSAAPPRFHFNNDAFAYWMQESLQKNAPIISSSGKIAYHLSVSRVTSHCGGTKPLPYLWEGCGGGITMPFNFEQRPTKLPDDPTLILAESYRGCERVKVAVLDSRVPVALYPEGYFSDSVYEKILIADRREFSDEPMLRQFFLSVSNAIVAVDNTWIMWFEPDSYAKLKVDDFRKEAAFIPEVVVEFAGVTAIRSEMNFDTGQALIQCGERWEAYEMEPAGSAALEKLIFSAREPAVNPPADS